MIKCCSPAEAQKIAVEFNNINVDNSDYFTTSTFNYFVRSQVGNFFIMHENIHSFGKFVDEFHSFASELNRAADFIVFSETWFSANVHLSWCSGLHQRIVTVHSNYSLVTPAFTHIVLTKQHDIMRSLCVH